MLNSIKRLWSAQSNKYNKQKKKKILNGSEQ
jgi:hypothetical protein